MALSRRSGRRFEANIWPGFVDAMTALLLVLIFIISIFMIVQFMLRDTIETQGSELDELAGSLNTLAVQLGLEQQRVSNLEDQVSRLGGLVDESSKEISRQRMLIASLVGKADEPRDDLSQRPEDAGAGQRPFAGAPSHWWDARGQTVPAGSSRLTRIRQSG